MEPIAPLPTRYRKLRLETSQKLGGPKWLRDIWLVELHDRTTKVAAVLDPAFRKKWQRDDADATEKLLGYDFQRVLKKHLREFQKTLMWTDWRAPPSTVNLRDLIFFEGFDEEGFNEMAKTPMWRIVDVRNRRALRYWLDQLEDPSNVDEWLKDPSSIYTQKQITAAPLLSLAEQNQASAAFKRYKNWCGGTSFEPVGVKAFAAALERNGIKKKKTNRGRVYCR